MSKRPPILPDPHREPTHPGTLLRRMVLPDLGRPMTEIARSLGISRSAPLGEHAGRLRPVARLTQVDVSKIPTLAAPRDTAE